MISGGSMRRRRKRDIPVARPSPRQLLPALLYLLRPCSRRSDRRECTRILLGALLTATAVGAQAHDFWIEPESFRPAPNARVPVRLFVGQHFKGESVPYLLELFERYTLVTARNEKSIQATLGDDPAGSIVLSEPGLSTIVYRGTTASVRFDTEQEFNAYLKMEGLEHIVQRHGTGKPPIREHYSRSAKALLALGKPDPAKTDRRLGLPLELIAEKNPYATGAARDLPVRLLYQGKPLAEATVIAFNKAAPDMKTRLRTDRDGRVRLRLDRSGVWLVTSVHMQPAPKGSSAHWESIWASLTFEVP
jgi:uncharacterized GH25 family protein